MTKLKGGNFLIEKPNPKNIFISAEWNEEQKMIFEMVKDFCVKNIQEPMLKNGRELDVHVEGDLERTVQLLEEAAALGLCGVAISEKFGGMDLDFNTGLLFSEAIAHGFSFATTIGAQTSIGSLPIVYYGTEEQKAKYLPGIASAKLKASYCLTEPNAGSDANAGKTSATLSEDGKHYLINGQKMWITNGGFADIFIVFAKIDKDEKLSAFIIEKEFGGITLGKEEKKMGIKGSSTVQVFFDNTKVPVENLLSKRGTGFKIALNILNTGRIKLAAGTIGGSKSAITNTLIYAKGRKQFDKAIIEFGAIQHKLGKMISHTYAIESAIFRTGKNIDLKTQELIASGMNSSEAKLNAIREYAVECAILKVKGSECSDFVLDEGIQIHGGMGYAAETGLETAYRDSRIARIYEGTNEINRLLAVAELTKRAVQTKELDLDTEGKKIPKYIIRRMLPFSTKKGLDRERQIVQDLKYTFLMLSGIIGRKKGKALIDEQEIVMNFSDILAEAYIADSVLMKYEKLKGMNLPKEELDIHKKIMQVYLYDAISKTKNAAEEAIAAYAPGKKGNKLRRYCKALLKQYDINPKDLRREITAYFGEKEKYCF